MATADVNASGYWEQSSFTWSGVRGTPAGIPDSSSNNLTSLVYQSGRSTYLLIRTYFRVPNANLPSGTVSSASLVLDINSISGGTTSWRVCEASTWSTAFGHYDNYLTGGVGYPIALSAATSISSTGSTTISLNSTAVSLIQDAIDNTTDVYFALVHDNDYTNTAPDSDVDFTINHDSDIGTTVPYLDITLGSSFPDINSVTGSNVVEVNTVLPANATGINGITI